jgi:outer membrane protein W
MKYIKILILIIITTALSNSQSLFKVNYNISFPNSNLKQLVDNTSFSGVNFEYARYFSRGAYSMGVSFGWNVFSEKYTGTTNFRPESESGNITGAVTGTQITYSNIFPMLVTGSYYFKPSQNTIIPYVAFGIGTYYVAQRFQIGVWTLDNDNWHLGVAPEAGIIFKLKNNLGLNTGAKLNYAFDSGETISGNDKNDISFWTINVGLTFVY